MDEVIYIYIYIYTHTHIKMETVTVIYTPSSEPKSVKKISAQQSCRQQMGFCNLDFQKKCQEMRYSVWSGALVCLCNIYMNFYSLKCSVPYYCEYILQHTHVSQSQMLNWRVKRDSTQWTVHHILLTYKETIIW